MASRWFIINEWLFSNLAGETDSQEKDPEDPKRRKVQSIRFLQALFFERDDGLVVLLGSPWMDKAQRWSDRTSFRSHQEQRLSKYFFGRFILNRNKCRALLPKDIVRLPDDLQRKLDANLIDKKDKYLLETWISSPVPVEYIVTTDRKLMKDLKDNWDAIKTRHRDDFLADYLNPSPAR